MLNKNDVEAQKRKRKQEQEDAGSGWSRLENKTNEASYTKSSMIEKPGMLSGAPKGGKDKSEINFTRSKPTFTNNKNKKRLDEDFPELGDADQQANADSSEVSKKDQANIGYFGAQAKSSQPRTDQQPASAAPIQEERKEASKPVFTSSKKKVLKGGDDPDSIQASKQNYDFSRLGMSTASNKVVQKDAQRDGEDSQNPEQARERKPKTYSDAPVAKAQATETYIENDFEVVQEKRRTRF